MAVVCLRDPSEVKIRQMSRWACASPGRHVVVIGQEAHSQDLPCVRYFPITEKTEEEVYQRIAWEFLYLPFTFEGEGLEKLERIRSEVNFLVSDFADKGVTVATNILQNLGHHAYAATSLYGKFPKIPAVICGAGPSLTKSGVALLKNKGLIFAAGAGVEGLKRLYLKPHFAAYVDPDPIHGNFKTEAPVFYHLRAAHRLITNASGPKLLVAGNGNYPLEHWAFPQPPFDGGWTAGTFCTALAYHLGCDPIIFVGMDLSSSSKGAYAEGISTEVPKEAFVSTQNHQGEKVLARLDWILARDWLNRFIEHHPERTWMDASSGLGFQGTKQVKLDQLDLPTLSLEPMIASAMASADEVLLPKPPSFENVTALIEKGLQELQAIFPKSFSGQLALIQTELSEEPLYAHVLEPAWKLWKPLVLKQNQNEALGEILNELLFYRSLIKDIQGVS